jgi:hypothetical protein
LKLHDFGRDAQFPLTYGRMCLRIVVIVLNRYPLLVESRWKQNTAACGIYPGLQTAGVHRRRLGVFQNGGSAPNCDEVPSKLLQATYRLVVELTTSCVHDRTTCRKHMSLIQATCPTRYCYTVCRPMPRSRRCHARRRRPKSRACTPDVSMSCAFRRLVAGT